MGVLVAYVKSVLVDCSRSTQDSDLKYMWRRQVAKNSKSKIIYFNPSHLFKF